MLETKPLRRGFERFYEELEPALGACGQLLPVHLQKQRMHLDPDFAALTYGDQGRRARQIQTLNAEDLLVFYASLRDIKERHLVYGIIGIFVIEKIYKANDVPRELWDQNAHTRRIPGASDIVVRAVPKLSGRLERFLPIGEYRNRAYRVARAVA